jgi:histidine phosphotransferase ChpT
MLVIAGQAIPRGGQLTVEPIGAGEAMGFKVSAAGANAKIPPAMPGLLMAETGGEAIDAHRIQPYYTALLAKDCKLTVGIANEGDSVVVSAR